MNTFSQSIAADHKDCHGTALPPVPKDGFSMEAWAAMPWQQRVRYRPEAISELSDISARTAEYVEGMVAEHPNFGPASEGYVHWYFTLSDEDKAQSEATMLLAFGQA